MHSSSRWDPRTSSPGSAEEERISGDPLYVETLARLHRELEPAFYLEIGVRFGRSLALAGCPAIGVDPLPEVKVSLPPSAKLAVATSDDFFAGLAADPLPQAPDLAFIDGMHWFEYALRDFIHIERLAMPTTLIVIDDIFPSHPAQAERERRTRVWTGDVWKLHRCLAEWRPDLILLPLDTSPTGLLLVAGLDSGNRVLSDRYDEILRQFGDDQAPPASVLERRGVLPAGHSAVNTLLSLLKRARHAGTAREEIARQLRAAVAEDAIAP